MNTSLIFKERLMEKKPGEFSEEYLEWVSQSGLPPLTNNQHRFAEWLLLKENASIISNIGDFVSIFNSVRRWLKNKKS